MRPWTPDRLKHFVETFWDNSILPSITEYIRIPNKSPTFDPQWVEHGYMEDAVEADGGLGAAAARRLRRRHAGGRAPARPHAADLHRDRRARATTPSLLYGHLDKQPEMTGWAEGLGPWKPVLKGDKLYGRGGADDGYAIFGSLPRSGRCRSRRCRTRAAWS